MNQNILQYIILDKKYEFDQQLFYLHTSNSFSTKTYFNLFHVGLWCHYTSISSLYVHLDLIGFGRVDIITSNNGVESQIETIICKNEAIKEIELPLNCDYIYIKWDDSITINKSYYYSYEPQKCSPNIAFIVTTYNREEDIKTFIHRFVDFQEKYNIKDNVRLYVVNNGNTLSVEENFENVIFINNKENYGGAGGFYIGLEKAYACEKEFTHFCFNDDDAIFHPETLFRCISLLKNIDTNFKNFMISASMFDKANTSFCSTILEGLKNNALHATILGNKNLLEDTELDSLNKLLDIQKNYSKYQESHHIKFYAAWWFCMFPRHLIDNYGFPECGYFFRGDDIEFSLRILPKILSLNGICVLHPAFKSKAVSNLRLYYNTRNFVLNNIKYYKNWKRNIIKYYLNRILKELNAKSLYNCEIVYLAFIDAFYYRNQLVEANKIDLYLLNHLKNISLFRLLTKSTILLYKILLYKKS